MVIFVELLTGIIVCIWDILTSMIVGIGLSLVFIFFMTYILRSFFGPSVLESEFKGE